MTRPRLVLLAAFCFALLAIPPGAGAAPGQLDPTFGEGGVVHLLSSEEKIAMRGVAVQPDDKIVLAGADFATQSALVVRLLPNGALDPEFGTGGIVSIAVPVGGIEARAVAIQPNGKIVVAGGATGVANIDFAAVRLNPDGSPDASFGGGDGIATVPVGTEFDEAEAVAIGPDGKIALTGRSDYAASERAAGVAVLEAGGDPDPSFNTTGTLMFKSTPKNDFGEAVAFRAGGRVLIADANAPGAGKAFTLAQFLSSGEPDPGFGGGDGVVETPIPVGGEPAAQAGRVADFALRPDGSIVAAGYGYDEIGTELDAKFVAVGYRPDGELDPGFGAGGIFFSPFDLPEESASSIELAENGRLVLAGTYAGPGDNSSPEAMRLTATGQVDTGFGAGGIALRGASAPFGDLFADAALDSLDRTVILSRAYLGGGRTDIAVVRYLGDREPQQTAINHAPHAKIKSVPKRARASKLKVFKGTASDPDGDALAKVQIALVRRVKTRTGKVRCLALKNARAKFKRVKARRGRGCPQRWLGVKGRAKWSFKLKRALPPGRYIVYARAVDSHGLAETAFSRKLRNRYGFRILPRGGRASLNDARRES